MKDILNNVRAKEPCQNHNALGAKPNPCFTNRMSNFRPLLNKPPINKLLERYGIHLTLNVVIFFKEAHHKKVYVPLG